MSLGTFFDFCLFFSRKSASNLIKVFLEQVRYDDIFLDEKAEDGIRKLVLPPPKPETYRNLSHPRDKPRG